MGRILIALAVGVLLWGCSGSGDSASNSDSNAPNEVAKVEANPKGVGPVSDAALGPIDHAAAKTGEEIFESKCAVCHKFEERYVGPALQGVTERREPEWILNMILNPDQMIKEDPTAKQLFTEYLTPMAFQNVTEEDARAILDYFRSVDAEASE